MSDHDVAIVGAGTSGAAAAAFCAERGLRVVCIDRRPLDRAGARWVNGVAARAFAEAGLPLPGGDEDRGGPCPFHLVAGYGPHKVVVEDHGVLEVDMRLLVRRLQDRARAAGAEFRPDTRVVDTRSLSAGELHCDGGSIRARFFVDASGLSGARLLDQAPLPPTDICAAAQQVRRVVDANAARAYFAQHGVAMGEVLCFAGIAGGYSILNLRSDGDHVSILTGSIPAAGHPSGKAILDDFAARTPWVGETLFGGARAIPLGRPRDRLARGNVAALGDAASQVFAAHGSGIGTGLVAARMLADALASGAGPEAYAYTWQRRHGGLLAGYDVFRRFSQNLAIADLERMMASGLMDPDMTRAGMAQVFPTLTVADVPGKLSALGAQPRLAAGLAGVAARMLAGRALYAQYPKNPRHIPRWSRAAAALFADRPVRR